MTLHDQSMLLTNTLHNQSNDHQTCYLTKTKTKHHLTWLFDQHNAYMETNDSNWPQYEIDPIGSGLATRILDCQPRWTGRCFKDLQIPSIRHGNLDEEIHWWLQGETTNPSHQGGHKWWNFFKLNNNSLHLCQQYRRTGAIGDGEWSLRESIPALHFPGAWMAISSSRNQADAS